jgi:hypothetical protein
MVQLVITFGPAMWAAIDCSVLAASSFSKDFMLSLPYLSFKLSLLLTLPSLDGRGWGRVKAFNFRGKSPPAPLCQRGELNFKGGA